MNIESEEVEGPQIVRASQSQTVWQFKEFLGRALNMDASKLRIVQDRYYNDLKALTSDNKMLRDEGFYRANKVGDSSVFLYYLLLCDAILRLYEFTTSVILHLLIIVEGKCISLILLELLNI